jgi:pilus assembly protein TadC
MIWLKTILAITLFIASLIYLPLYLFFISCAALLLILRNIEKEISYFKDTNRSKTTI